MENVKQETGYNALLNVCGGTLTVADEDQMKRYVKWFKSHGFGTNEIKNSWGEHMDLSHISGYSKDVAYAYIDSIYKSL